MVIVILVAIIVMAGIAGLFYTIFKGTKVAVQRASTAEEYKADISCGLKHVSGLPVPAGIMVELYCTKEKMIIKKDTQEITLSANKLKSVDSVIGRDLQSQADGALAGGLLFGLSGAVLGALVGSSTYLVITYEGDGEIKHIILDTVTAPGNARKVADYYRETTAAKDQKIEL